MTLLLIKLVKLTEKTVLKCFSITLHCIGNMNIQPRGDCTNNYHLKI